jgi:dTDP-4-amino-4,6-dideoxygalactose transaminase
MKKINIFEPFFRKEEILKEIGICLDKGWTGLGFKTIEFELEWSDYTGLPHSHFLSSNTVGLHLALRVFKEFEGWEEGDEIITTPLTFVSTNHSILYENLEPVFADVDEYLCLDPNSVEEKITERTRAVMFVGIGGNPGQLDKIKDICDKYEIRLILDAAHMSGTYIKNGNKVLHVGSEADATIFSFQAVKNLPTADSGMICFKSKEHDEFCRKLSWLGIDKDTFSRTNKEGNYKWRYDVPYLGYKYHGNSIMAAMGLVQLKYIDEDNSFREKISKKYLENLIDLKHISVIKTSKYCHKSSRHLFQILVDENSKFNRDQVIEKLQENSIYPGVHYIDNTKYSMYKNSYGNCPNSHSLSERVISLPLHLRLKDEDVSHVINTLFSIFN